MGGPLAGRGAKVKTAISAEPHNASLTLVGYSAHMAGLELLYSRTARSDWRIWVMLIVGAIFAYLSFTVDPVTNCDESGNCVGWVVHVARALGLFFSFAGVALLAGNHRRGSGVDPQTGELVWWYGKPKHPKRHPLQDISRIRVDIGSDSDDVHLYDGAGGRIGFTGTEVIPWPYQDWAQRLTERYPHIKLEVRD